MTARRHPAVDAYVTAVNQADLDELTALFAPGATLQHPLGTFAGTDQIAGSYRDVVLAGRALVTAGATLADGPLVMAEITATSPLDPDAGQAHAIDVFHLDDHGRIAGLDIYYR